MRNPAPLLIGLLALGGCARDVVGAPAAARTNDWLLIGGVRAGPLTADSSEAELKGPPGPAQVITLDNDAVDRGLLESWAGGRLASALPPGQFRMAIGMQNAGDRGHFEALRPLTGDGTFRTDHPALAQGADRGGADWRKVRAGRHSAPREINPVRRHASE